MQNSTLVKPPAKIRDTEKAVNGDPTDCPSMKFFQSVCMSLLTGLPYDRTYQFFKLGFSKLNENTAFYLYFSPYKRALNIIESKFYGTTKITVSEGDFRLGFDPRVRMNAQSFLRGSLIATVLASGSATPLSAEPLEITAGFAAVNDPSFGQREDLGFGEAYQTWLELSGGQGLTDYTLRVSLAETDADARVSLDGSHVSLGGGPWSVSLGAKERNWSFSPNTSLIWSQNARPVPALSFERANSPNDNFWFGDWSGEIVFGGLNSVNENSNVQMFGARLVVTPLPGLDVEFVRTAQWGGDGRPGGFDAFWNMFIGNSNQGNNTDPANQLGGFGLSYQVPDTIAPLRVYVQGIGEDEGHGLPSCYMYLAGAEWSGAVGSVPTSVVLEGLNTVIDYSGGGRNCGPNTAYAGQYGGYTNYGEVMGAAVDTAGQSIGIDVLHDFGDYAIGWGANQVFINDTNNSGHRLSSVRVEGQTGYLSYERAIGQGRVEARLSYQGFDLDTAGLTKGVRGAVNYEFTF